MSDESLKCSVFGPVIVCIEHTVITQKFFDFTVSSQHPLGRE